MKQLETIRSYWNTRADGYSKSVMEEMEDAQKEGTYWKTLLDTYLPKEDNSKVLDLGCGPGFFTMLLGQKGCQMTAFDYSDGMLAQAKQNAASVGVTAEFVQGDAQDLPFEDETFDMIVTRNLTWNLEQPEKAYKEWLRVLKPAAACSTMTAIIICIIMMRNTGRNMRSDRSIMAMNINISRMWM